jgi:hypothetical protein
VTRAKISEYSATAGDNTDVNGVNIAEGCPPSSMNNMGREIMAALKRFQVGSDGDGVTVGGQLAVTGTTTTSPAIVAAGDTNTGIFFPAADTIAFAEGGAEAMRIDSSGNAIFGNAIYFNTPSSGTTNAYGFITYTSAGSVNIYADNGSAYANSLISMNVDGSERMRITSAGEVLVGGTTDINSVPSLSVQRTNAPSILSMYRNDTTISSGDHLFSIEAWGNDTTSNTPTNLAYIRATASGTHAAGDNPTDLVFGCTNDGSETVAEFARLSGSSANSRSFTVRQPTLTNDNSSVVNAAGGTAGTLNRYASIAVAKHSGITNACGALRVFAEDAAENWIWADNSDVLRISTTFSNIGTTGGTVVGTQTSDERLKDISGPVSYGLNEVLAIEPIAFTMKDDPSIPKIGFSAQQVQPIVPEAVYDTKECIDGYTENEETKEQIANSDRTKLAMEYTQLIPVLVNAVKELSAKCDALQAEVNLLKGN